MSVLAQPGWNKVTLTYDQLAAAATTGTATIFSLPAKGIVHQVVAKHSASFTGGAISAYTVQVGVAGTVAKYLAAFNVFQAPGAAVASPASTVTPVSASPINFTAATPLIVTATSTSANTEAATAGSVDVWLLVSILP